MTIGRALAAFAVALLPTAVDAASFQLRNCNVAPIDVVVIRPDTGMISMQTVVAASATGSLQCPTDGCALQIHYSNVPGPIGNFPGPIKDDRCTRGLIDVSLTDLPPIGNCGC